MHHAAPIVEEIFLAALAIEGPEARSSYLDAACGDPDLRRRVERLLALDAQASGFLERPPAELGLDDTQGFTGPEADTESAGDDADVALDFLGRSNQEGSLGRLGTYEVQAVVGRGGMGIVLKALDTRLNRTVALKVLAPELAANATARKRFQREARAAAAVAHPHVVTIHAVEEDRLPYLVMELVQGISLRDKIEREGPLPLTEILRIGSQVAAGLAAAHKQGLIHRDIKPANILLENGVHRVKVTDFGLARAVDDVDISQTGEVAGTPLYMSPEQAEGLPLDARSDLFSLGSVLYTMCTGRAPFRADSAVAVLRRVCDATPRPIREVNPEIPEWLCATIDRLLAKDPEARYQSAQEVADLLNQFLAHWQQHSAAPLPVASAPSLPRPKRLRNGARSWGAAAAVLLLLAAGLGATEATGLTHLSTTIIRILVPGGTLVVETDDPDVQMTIEGDGGLVITGAGSQEVRLRPGSYQVHSSKAGKPVPLDRDLVTITRDAKQVVKVRIEGEPPATAKAAVGAEARSFVVLGVKGVADRRFRTLIEAVQASSEGDTIEVRGNGRFVTKQVGVGHALTIRAGGGFRPVIRHSPDDGDERGRADLIQSNNSSPLVLEGLELWGTRLSAAKGGGFTNVVLAESPLHIANCRLVSNRSSRMLQAPALTRLTNCELVAEGASDMVVHGEDQPRFLIDNCLIAMPIFELQHWAPGFGDIHVQVTNSSYLTRKMGFALGVRMPSAPPDQERVNGALAIDVSRSIIRTPSLVDVDGASVEEADALLRRFLHWRGDSNAYDLAGGFLFLNLNGRRVSPGSIMRLDEWRQFSGSAEPGCIHGSVKFQGGDLVAKAATDPEHLTPEDFRLRPDSAGYRAGPDGKDLGADIDLVGPGAAYERWKKTDAYQEWLKDIERAHERTAQAVRQKAQPDPIWTDPDDWTLRPDFQIQGEYVGDVAGGRRLGCQVIALGDGAFQAVVLPGGLPGAGWYGTTRILMDGKLAGDQAVFTPAKGEKEYQARAPEAFSATDPFPPQGQKDYSATIAGEVLTGWTDGGKLFTLKKVVRQSPTLGARPPQRALVLFDGQDKDAWTGGRLDKEHGILVAEGSQLVSARHYNNYTLHVEFRVPFKPRTRGFERGDSGVWNVHRYEVQVHDSFGLDCHGLICGGLNHEAAPQLNMCLPPLVWQTFDIDFTNAVQQDGKKVRNARITVRHNGVLIHDNVEFARPTVGAPWFMGSEGIPGPILLQWSNPAYFRNIWIVEK